MPIDENDGSAIDVRAFMAASASVSSETNHRGGSVQTPRQHEALSWAVRTHITNTERVDCALDQSLNLHNTGTATSESASTGIATKHPDAGIWTDFDKHVEFQSLEHQQQLGARVDNLAIKSTHQFREWVSMLESIEDSQVGSG
jgi:hypothetical protein